MGGERRGNKSVTFTCKRIVSAVILNKKNCIMQQRTKNTNKVMIHTAVNEKDEKLASLG